MEFEGFVPKTGLAFKTLINPFRTTVPFWGTNQSNYE